VPPSPLLKEQTLDDDDDDPDDDNSNNLMDIGKYAYAIGKYA
jgi:hypothetical protein